MKFLKQLLGNKRYLELEKKLIYADIRKNPLEFVFFKMLNTYLLFLILIFFVNIFVNLIIVISFYFLYEYFVIEPLIKKRINKLDESATEFLEIFILAMETGSDIEGSIKLATYNESDLSKEFHQVLLEINLGYSLTESLEKLTKRMPSESINNILLSISDTKNLGVKLIPSLHEQLAYLRKKTLLDKKAIINQIPIKVSVVSVLIILPLIFLLVLGPLFIEFLR